MFNKTKSFNTPLLELLVLNKFLIPAALVATVVIAGIFAFMPVEKASTVHGSLSTNIQDVDRAFYFKFNQSIGSAFSSTGIQVLPGSNGLYSGSYTISATPS